MKINCFGNCSGRRIDNASASETQKPGLLL